MKNIFIFFLLVAGTCYGQAPTTKGGLALREADSLFDSGNYNVSLNLYRYSDSLNSQKNESPYIHVRIAECLLQLEQLEEAEKVAESILKSRNRNTRVVEAHLIMGQIYLSKGNTEDAKISFTRAFDLIKFESNSLTKSKCYDQLGIFHWIKGNQAKALELLTISLDMRKDLVGENHLAVANSYNNLGLVLANGDPDKALDYYNKALAIYRSNYSMQHPKVGITLNNIAITQRQMGNIDDAIQTFNQSLEIWKQLVGKNHSMIAFIYTNLGETYSFQNKYSISLDYLTKGLNLYQSIYGDKHPEIAATYNSIGNIYLHQGESYSALKSFQLALKANSINFNSDNIYKNPAVNNFLNPDLLLVTLSLKSKSLILLHHEKTLKLRDLEFALSTLQSSDSLINLLRRSRSSMKDKIELGKQSAIIYEQAIITSLELSLITLKKSYYEELAFQYSEKNKGAVLQEAIAEVEAKSFADIPDSLLIKEKELRLSITSYEQKLAKEQNSEEEKEFRKKLFEVSALYEQHIQFLEYKYPNYYNLKFNTSTISIAKLQSSLTKGETLVSYYLSEENKRLIIFYITSKTFNIENKPLPADYLKEIKILRNSIMLMADAPYLKSAHTLYHVLFPDLPTKTTSLIIIPDGKLGSIPFEALLTKPSTSMEFKNQDYLIKKYSIGYNYSSQLFFNSRNNQSTKSLTKGILLSAPVNFESHPDLNSLPGTAFEVEKIEGIFQQKNITASALLYENANESSIKKLCSNYKYIHVASHGIVNETQPELSQLFLNPTSDNSDDGNLYFGEIYNLKINADLVVLSACQTGLGNLKKGEGIIGLSRALLYSGADNIIVSLWSVSDESTSELMVKFYETLLSSTAHTLSYSLRESKLKLIGSEKFSHPKYWAPFVLIGN